MFTLSNTDNLGNVRMSYTLDTSLASRLKILDENHYYPFGLKHERYLPLEKWKFIIDQQNIEKTKLKVALTDEYKYKFGQKEYQDELGLNMYDYGARNYDAALGRWMNVDPLTEEFPSWSPYNFVYNNPIKFVDPTGMAPMHDYKLLQNGDVKLIRETNDNSDTLYSTNELGQVTADSNSITVAKNSPQDTSIIGELSSGRSLGMSTDLTPPGNIGFFSEGFTNDLNTAFNLYNFLDNNTRSGIEFSLSKFSVGGNDMFQIATMHKIIMYPEIQTMG